MLTTIPPTAIAGSVETDQTAETGELKEAYEEGTVKCMDCQSLLSNQAFSSMITMAERTLIGGLHDTDLNFLQIQQRKNEATKRRDRLSFAGLNVKRNLLRAKSSLAYSQELLELLAENDVPRAKQLLGRCLREGRGLQFIIFQLQQAIDGLYSPRNYEKEDFQIAILVHRLGSRKLLYALAKAKGFCSRSSLYDKYLVELPRFECCARGSDAKACILQNLERFVYAQPCEQRCMWLFIIDDVAVDERIRWDQWTNRIVGLCREHSHDVNVTFDSTDVLDRLKYAIDQGKVHYGSEATVGALVPLRGNNYSAIPLFVSLTCKKDETASSLAPFMEHFFSAWYADSRGYKQRGPCGACISDGAANFRLAAAEQFNSNLLRPNIEKYHEGEIFALLSQLRLFDLKVGRFLVVDGSDDRHGGKRFRERIKSKSKGMLLSREVLHSAAIEQMLRLLGETDASTVPLFAPADAMNVETTVRLFKVMDKYKNSTLDDLLDGIQTPTGASVDTLDQEKATVEFGEVFKEFRLLASICSCMYKLLGTNHLSVSEHLSNLSTLSHLLFVIFRKNAGAFIAPQTYENWQSSIKEHFVVVARCKVEGLTQPYYIFQDSGNV